MEKGETAAWWALCGTVKDGGKAVRLLGMEEVGLQSAEGWTTVFQGDIQMFCEWRLDAA